jgi:hypothetical protein
MPNITIALLEEFMNNLIASRSQACAVHSCGTWPVLEHASVQLCTSVHNMSSAYWQKGYHRCRLPYLQLLSWRPTLVRCSPAIDPAIDDLQQLYLVIIPAFQR